MLFDIIDFIPHIGSPEHEIDASYDDQDSRRTYVVEVGSVDIRQESYQHGYEGDRNQQRGRSAYDARASLVE